MGASITLAGESLIAQKQGAQQILTVSRFILANVPGLDPNGPVDRAAGKPAAGQIVGTYDVTQAGYVNPNQVVYSLMLGSDIGDFDWNWIGLETAENVLLMVAYVPTQQKRRNIPPLQLGNNVIRNFLVVFDGAQALTGLTVDASTWQHDFTVRLAGIDERERQSNRDMFGRACFFGSALQLEKVGSVYQLKPGTAYVEGVRLQRSAALPVVPPAFPTTAWLDVALQRELNDVVASWSVVWGAGKVDYVDSAGVQHYCVAIADLPNSSTITDRRPVENIAGPLVEHFASEAYVDQSIATRQPLHVNLTAFAGLAGATDKLPYFSAAGELNLATITAKARGLLGSADEAAMRTFLQLVKQTAANDTTAGAMLTVGGFGNGAPRFVTNADDVTLGADHVVLQAPFTNGPTAATHYIFSMCSSISSGGQIALTYGADRAFFRKKVAGIWSPTWVEFWHAANLAPAELSPPGAVAHFARNSAPTGWLKANGAAVSRTTYAPLFAAIGTQFGAGDGSNTFNLPDLRGEFLRSWDDARGVDTGREFGSAQRGTLYGFDTGQSAIYNAGTSGTGDLASVQGDMGADPYSTSDYPNGRLVTLGNSSNAALPGNAGQQAGSGITRPRNVALLACIKY